MVHSLADFGVLPASMLEEHWFGIVMDSGQFIHRKGYRALWENMLVLSPREIPLEIFLASGYSRAESEKLHYQFNASMQARGN